jgi:hypothetical protein
MHILVIIRFKAYLNKRKQITEPVARDNNNEHKKTKFKGVKTTKTVLAMSI